MKKLISSLMLVAILGVGAASASAQGFDRSRTVEVTTSFDGRHDGSDRDRRGGDWRRMEQERLDRERRAHEQDHWFNRDSHRDGEGNLRFRRF